MKYEGDEDPILDELLSMMIDVYPDGCRSKDLSNNDVFEETLECMFGKKLAAIVGKDIGGFSIEKKKTVRRAIVWHVVKHSAQ